MIGQKHNAQTNILLRTRRHKKMYKYKNKYYKVIKFNEHGTALLKEYKKVLWFYIKTKNKAFWEPSYNFKKYTRCK